MAVAESALIPLAALGVPEHPDLDTDAPLAYVPRIPEASSYQQLIERAVNWGRR
ncbi:MAG: hypothetical protein L3K23_00575 [Thermoplasmata archaeon]|nr:hypothetical protein [Thermoplasmata archaeon]